MSFTDDSTDATDKDIKAKLNLHVKQRIKQTSTMKRKQESNTDDPEAPPEGSTKKPPGKQQKAKKSKPSTVDEEDSDRGGGGGGDGDLPEVSSPKKVTTLDVLQLLLNKKKLSLMQDPEVIELIRKKQGRGNVPLL